jgi:hypothetical protein
MSGEAKTPAPLAAVKPAPVKLKVVTEAYSFRRQGLPHVRKAATVFAMVLLVSSALVAAGRFMVIKTRPATELALENNRAAHERLMQAQNERSDIDAFGRPFEQLRARGFVGPENRLAMIEAIRDIQRTHGLLAINYEFAPQQVVVLDPALLEPPLELHSTTIGLKMGLLHEMDLVNFLRDLRAKGNFTVKDCTITPLDAATSDAQTPRQSAECTLYWLSVGEALPVAPAAAGG